MGYALFAQRKLCLTGQLNCLNLQQTQRSNEQLQLATNTLSLQQQLTSLQTAQSQELAQKYEKLANAGDNYAQVRNITVTEDGERDYDADDNVATANAFLGYINKNNIAEDDKFYAAYGYVGKSYKGKEGFIDEEEYHQQLSEDRQKTQWEIQQLEAKFKQEEDVINRQIYQVSIKENAIEMEVKRLDTKITAIQKQLEAVEEAEGAGIDRATPKFNGIG